MSIKELDKLLISIAQRLGNKTPKSVKTIISLLEKYTDDLSSGQRRKLYDFLRTAELDLFNLHVLDRNTMSSLTLMIEDVRRGKEEKKESKTEKTEEKEGFIYVPSIKLWVSKERERYGLSWEKTQEKLKEQGYQMLTIPEFIEFLKFTRKNYPEIYEDITVVRSPWRAEWLDAFFKEEKGVMYIYTRNTQKKEKLIPCLMKNKTPGIDLNDWLNNPTKQGLPKSNVKEGKLYYWCPENGTVARFLADSGRASLNCGRNPQSSDSALGVRPAKKF